MKNNPELKNMDEFIYHYIPMEKWAEAKDIMDTLVSHREAEARKDELEMATGHMVASPGTRNYVKKRLAVINAEERRLEL